MKYLIVFVFCLVFGLSGTSMLKRLQQRPPIAEAPVYPIPVSAVSDAPMVFENCWFQNYEQKDGSFDIGLPQDALFIDATHGPITITLPISPRIYRIDIYPKKK